MITAKEIMSQVSKVILDSALTAEEVLNDLLTKGEVKEI